LSVVLFEGSPLEALGSKLRAEHGDAGRWGVGSPRVAKGTALRSTAKSDPDEAARCDRRLIPGLAARPKLTLTLILFAKWRARAGCWHAQSGLAGPGGGRGALDHFHQNCVVPVSELWVSWRLTLMIFADILIGAGVNLHGFRWAQQLGWRPARPNTPRRNKRGSSSSPTGNVTCLVAQARRHARGELFSPEIPRQFAYYSGRPAHIRRTSDRLM